MHSITGYALKAVGQPLERMTWESPGPGPGEAMVEVVGCGVCHTDLGFAVEGVPTRHPLPLVLGHEVAGIVVEEGEGVGGLKGRAVIVPAVIPCGRCGLCREGLGEICRAQVFPGNDVHGGFATHLIVPASGLSAVPEALSDRKRLASLSVCADAVSTAWQAIRKSEVARDDFAIFVGVGGVGGFGVQLASALGAKVLALDVDDARLARLAEHGATWTMNVRGRTPKDIKKEVRALAKQAGLPAVKWKIFETSGTQAGQETAFALLTFGARLGVVGFYPGQVNVRLSNLMAFSASAVGTWGCLPALFPEVLELVAAGKVALDPFIETFPMSRINHVFEALRGHELSRRPVLIPDF